MGNGSKSGASKSASHQLFKDRAKNRVDDLQGMFSDLQSARKESRTIDVALLEEQVHQMLREWKAELSEPSPASSLQQEGSLGFSSEICRLLQLYDVEDDATSALAAPKPEPDSQKVMDISASREGFDISKGPQEQGVHIGDQCQVPGPGVDMGINNICSAPHLDYNSFEFHQQFDQQYFSGYDGTYFTGEDGFVQISGYPQNISPPPSAFLGPKCALWDCTRPAQGLDWCEKSDNYCSDYHSWLACREVTRKLPVIRPGGIGLKDNLLFAALSAKAQGKEVGIAECEGAATAKSPWNAPDLFDLKMLEAEGETIREWLFFDKPRRAFESGNRKQRSLPDYNGRGWHESRKQVMNEYGGLKRSYYMDPQPMELFEWHLFEYEINKYDVCALYRLEFKRVDGKKSPKGKLSNDSVADLQKQMGKLTAEFPSDNKRPVKGRGKANLKDNTGSIYSANNAMTPTSEGLDYYLVDDLNGYYLT